MSLLSLKQKTELYPNFQNFIGSSGSKYSKYIIYIYGKCYRNSAIHQYLVTNHFTHSANAFLSEANLEESSITLNPPGSGSILEKKWTAVVRLQRKIIELESKIAQLSQDLEENSVGSVNKTKSKSDLLPRGPFRCALNGHRLPLSAIVFHPTYSIIITASEDATIKVWDVETGDFDQTLKGHTKAVTDLAIDAKGTFLVSCSADLSIKVWDITNDYANTRTMYGHDHSVSSVALLSNARLVSASRDKTIKFWDLSNGFCLRTIHESHTDWVRMAVPCDDSRLVATCSNDQSAKVWDCASYECKMQFVEHEHVVECVTFVPVSGYECVKSLIQSLPGTANGISNGSAPTSSLHSSQTTPAIPGLYLVTGSRDKQIKLWDVNTGQCLKTLSGHENWVRSLAFHPSGKYLLSASDDKSVKCWDLSTGQCVRTLTEAHDHFVTFVAMSPRSYLVATGSVDKSARIWKCK